MNRLLYKMLIFHAAMLISCHVDGQGLAFPEAEGFGKSTTGGRGGEVMVVTNLNDSGKGSLREAVSSSETRIITFAVAGNIALESPLEIKHGNLTIAGQSAPGDGICIRNYPVNVKAGNIIIRYLRIRMGDEAQVEGDALSIRKQKDIIVDHCSFSWGTDETATCYDNENFTLQWCIISESLNSSVHKKGEHGYGGIWGGKKATFHHNLLAHHKSRNPRFCGARYHREPEKEIVDFRNNVIYNWKENSSYGGEEGNHNMVSNYYKPGPATSNSKFRIMDPFKPYGSYFLSGNVFTANAEITADNSKGITGGNLRQTPVLSEPIHQQTAEAAFESVLSQAGASLHRDRIDKRIVKEVLEGKATYGKSGIIDSQTEVGGWCELKAGEVPTDKDCDGMPDDWEISNGLDPNNPDDHAGNNLSESYSNIEIYLNQLLEMKRDEKN
ncbi:pectate lyase [Limibacter armeniacum]|uniref:pectate lyase family protein n=1 Tax=Limibacter armeniacum TaxID=466084 RepID=UPI002FE52679